ncbi:MAG: FHA domain-containing protein [Myxococcota bacterium]|nr:FHA domain-containing protein [Myxococcota bacterium]
MTLPFAGVVVVWSGIRPRLETYRIPKEGLVFGREHADASDERISRLHMELTVEDGRIIVEDRNSTNGTQVNDFPVFGRSVRPWLPAIVRTGRTISMLVPDLRPYEHIPISRRGDIVVAGSLDHSCRAIDMAAIEEENVLIVGASSIGRTLGLEYARAIGGKHVLIAPTPQRSIADAFEDVGAVRTVILDIDRPVTGDDLTTLASWLETDVRFVTCVRSESHLRGNETSIVRALVARIIELPRCRFDELPTTFHEIIAARVPTATLHATAIEYALLRVRDMDEDLMLARFRDAVAAFPAGETILRDEHLTPYLAVPHNPRHAGVFPVPGR